MGKIKGLLKPMLVFLFGNVRLQSLIKIEHKFLTNLLNFRNYTINIIFLVLRFRKVFFRKYDNLNINHDLPALILHGFYGITFIGKKRYINSRIFINDYSKHQSYAEIIRISQFNGGNIPIAIFESNFLKFSSYEIKQKIDKKIVELGARNNLKIIVGNSNLPKVVVPFIEGFFHYYVELMPLILKNITKSCFILQVPQEKFYVDILKYFCIKYVEIPNSEIGMHYSQFTIIKEGLYPSKNDLRILRKHTTKKISLASEYKNRIYITRRNNKNGRRIQNEKSIIDLLVKNDFIVIDPDELVFDEQVKLMQTASIVISAHGAALSHLVCVPKKCKVIELNGNVDIRWHYFKISKDLNLKYYLITGNTLNRHEFHIEVNKIEEVLHLII
jgi:hypothetical protein